MCYSVLSPDGFRIDCQPFYASRADAERALMLWCARYRTQGYYRDNNWRQIPLADLPAHCRIVHHRDNDATCRVNRQSLSI